MDQGIVFCPVVGCDSGDRPPVVLELPLRVLLVELVELHVHQFGVFGGDYVGEYAVCHQIIYLHWCFLLWVAKFNNCYPDVYCQFCIDEQRS